MVRFLAYVQEETGDIKRVKSRKQDFEFGAKKFMAPKANEIRTIKRPWNLLGDLQFAIYRYDSPRAIPVSGDAPEGLNPTDFMNLTGGYIPSVLRKAFQEDLTRVLLIIACVAGALGFAIGAVDLYFIYKIAKSLHLA